jgi:hypothetical protein
MALTEALALNPRTESGTSGISSSMAFAFGQSLAAGQPASCWLAWM